MVDEPTTTQALGIPPENEDRQAFRHHAQPPADQPEGLRRFVIEAARLASDLKCENVIVLDVRELSDVTDYIIIASGTSDRQMHSVSADLKELSRDHGLVTFGREADRQTTWIVLDFVDVVVHLFEPATRAHYDLEMLWGDAQPVDWRR